MKKLNILVAALLCSQAPLMGVAASQNSAWHGGKQLRSLDSGDKKIASQAFNFKIPGQVNPQTGLVSASFPMSKTFANGLSISYGFSYDQSNNSNSTAYDGHADTGFGRGVSWQFPSIIAPGGDIRYIKMDGAVDQFNANTCAKVGQQCVWNSDFQHLRFSKFRNVSLWRVQYKSLHSDTEDGYELRYQNGERELFRLSDGKLVRKYNHFTYDATDPQNTAINLIWGDNGQLTKIASGDDSVDFDWVGTDYNDVKITHYYLKTQIDPKSNAAIYVKTPVTAEFYSPLATNGDGKDKALQITFIRAENQQGGLGDITLVKKIQFLKDPNYGWLPVRMYYPYHPDMSKVKIDDIKVPNATIPSTTAYVTFAYNGADVTTDPDVSYYQFPDPDNSLANNDGITLPFVTQQVTILPKHTNATGKIVDQKQSGHILYRQPSSTERNYTGWEPTNPNCTGRDTCFGLTGEHGNLTTDYPDNSYYYVTEITKMSKDNPSESTKTIALVNRYQLPQVSASFAVSNPDYPMAVKGMQYKYIDDVPYSKLPANYQTPSSIFTAVLNVPDASGKYTATDSKPGEARVTYQNADMTVFGQPSQSVQHKCSAHLIFGKSGLNSGNDEASQLMKTLLAYQHTILGSCTDAEKQTTTNITYDNPTGIYGLGDENETHHGLVLSKETIAEPKTVTDANGKNSTIPGGKRYVFNSLDSTGNYIRTSVTGGYPNDDKTKAFEGRQTTALLCIDLKPATDGTCTDDYKKTHPYCDAAQYAKLCTNNGKNAHPTWNYLKPVAKVTCYPQPVANAKPGQICAPNAQFCDCPGILDKMDKMK